MNLEQFARARGLHKMLTTNRQAVVLAYKEYCRAANQSADGTETKLRAVPAKRS